MDIAVVTPQLNGYFPTGLCDSFLFRTGSFRRNLYGQNGHIRKLFSLLTTDAAHILYSTVYVLYLNS